jgi:hypothetical protein
MLGSKINQGGYGLIYWGGGGVLNPHQCCCLHPTRNFSTPPSKKNVVDIIQEVIDIQYIYNTKTLLVRVGPML